MRSTRRCSCSISTRCAPGRRWNAPTYDYTVHNRAAETITVTPAKVIVVEGILIFAEPELRERLDIKLFVDTDADVRILRRIVRDVRDRGRDLESIVTQYLTTVKPMHEMFVEPSKRYADIIIPKAGIIRSHSILSWSASGLCKGAGLNGQTLF